ncbi:MAG: twin-arginine translocase subunit TatC [Acidobacteriota bacterium]
MAGTNDQAGVPPQDHEISSQEEVVAAEQTAEATESTGEAKVSYEQTTDATASYGDPYYDDYGYEPPADPAPASTTTALVESTPVSAPVPATASGSGGSTPPPYSGADDEEEDDDEGGMLRMSFMEHLEELRSRLIKALAGAAVAFAVAIYFNNEIWTLVSEPAMEAMRQAGIKDPKLAILTPTEGFSVIWVQLPILTSIFLASPWILYQIWAFIAPGLYKRERKWAVPFVISSAGLFILGGLFAYFVAFKLGLAFLIGIGVGNNAQAVISLSNYLDLFTNVSLGMGLVFELPVLIFFLSLLRIVTPGFLIRNSRYAILGIVIVAAIVTPTPDVVNLMLLALPMTLLYFMGVFASYLLTLSRENKRFPWLILFLIVAGFFAVFAGGTYLAVTHFGWKLVPAYPFLIR